MDGGMALLAAGTGYLIGSVSFARVVAHFAAPAADVTGFVTSSTAQPEGPRYEITSATAVGMNIGERYGGLAGILDILKVLIPALAAKVLFPGQSYFLLYATGAMLGHCWPVYYRFRGGRGLSAALGGMLAVSWPAVLAAWLASTLFGLLLRNEFMVYLGGLWLFIPVVWLATGNAGYVLFAVAINVIFLVAMIPEIRTISSWRRQGLRMPFEEALQVTPMGRGIYRVGRTLRLVK